MDTNANGVDDFSIWNISHVLSHIKDNAISFILLICVFFIIYCVDRLANYNLMLMSMPAAAAIMPPQILKKGKRNRRL